MLKFDKEINDIDFIDMTRGMREHVSIRTAFVELHNELVKMKDKCTCDKTHSKTSKKAGS